MVQKSFLEEMSNQGKPASFSEETFVQAPKKKPVWLFFLIGLAIVIGALWYINSKVEVPDFSDWNVERVNNWAKKNGPTIIVNKSYSLEKENGMVLSQGVEAGERISKKADLEVTFSQGPDPNETLAFPDIKSMSVEEIQAWIEENQLSGISLKYDNSDTIAKGQVITFELVDGTEANFIRKNRVKVSISKGPSVLSETLSMADLYGKTKTEVMKWSIDNNLKVNITEEFNEFVNKDYVVSQSIPKNSKISRDDAVDVVISLGKPVKVPDFTGLSSSEASSLASLYKLRIFLKGVEGEGDVNEIIYQDIEAGGQVVEDTIITLHEIKETAATVGNFVGMSKEKASEFASVKGIKVYFDEVASTEPLGTVISQSHSQGVILGSNDILTLTVSRGDIIVPNFVGLSRDKADQLSEELGIKIKYTDVKTTKKANNQVLTQSIPEGQALETSKTLYLEISTNGGVVIPDLTSYTKADAEIWAETNGVSIKFIEQYSGQYKKGTLYNQNYKNMYLPENATVILYYALGDIYVKDFSGMKKIDVINWVDEMNEKGANLKVSYKEATSTEYEKGQIMSQTSIDEYVEVGKAISFSISKEKIYKSVKIPNLVGLTESEFLAWCSNNSVSYKILTKYDGTKEDGVIIKQDKIDVTLDKDEVLIVTKSLGKVMIPNFAGQSQNEVYTWQEKVNKDGAKVSVVFQTMSSDKVAAGNVISQTYSGPAGTEYSITVYVSSGS